MNSFELRDRFIPDWMRRRNRQYNWDEFNPDRYHEHNYMEIEPMDDEVLGDLDEFYRKEKPSGLFLEIGAGPNMYPILAALPYADQIDVWELGGQNVNYLRRQVEEMDPSWQKWMDKLRELNPERYGQVDFQKQLQQKMRVIQGNIFDLPEKKYDSISMHSVAESLTKVPHQFRKAVTKFTAAGKPGSTLVASFVANSRGYNTPGRNFPAVAIETWDVVKILGPSMRSLKFGTTRAELRPLSPLIITLGTIK